MTTEVLSLLLENKIMENKNIDALGDFMRAYQDPFGTIKDFDGIVRFMGAVNQLTYGMNPYGPKAEFSPIIEREDDEIDDEKEAKAELRAERDEEIQSEHQAYELAH